MITRLRDGLSSISLSLIIIPLFLLLFFVGGTIFVYNWLGNIFINQYLVEFENELTTMINRQRRGEVEAQLPEELMRMEEGSLLFGYDNLASRDPFRAQLTKIEEPEQEIESDQEEEQELELNDHLNGEEEREESEERIGPRANIEVVGILGSDANRRAIIRIGATSYIVNQGHEVESLKVKAINSEEVIFSREGQEFAYRLGGGED